MPHRSNDPFAQSKMRHRTADPQRTTDPQTGLFAKIPHTRHTRHSSRRHRRYASPSPSPSEGSWEYDALPSDDGGWYNRPRHTRLHPETQGVVGDAWRDPIAAEKDAKKDKLAALEAEYLELERASGRLPDDPNVKPEIKGTRKGQWVWHSDELVKKAEREEKWRVWRHAMVVKLFWLVVAVLVGFI